MTLGIVIKESDKRRRHDRGDHEIGYRLKIPRRSALAGLDTQAHADIQNIRQNDKRERLIQIENIIIGNIHRRRRARDIGRHEFLTAELINIVVDQCEKEGEERHQRRSDLARDREDAEKEIEEEYQRRQSDKDFSRAVTDISEERVLALEVAVTCDVDQVREVDRERSAEYGEQDVEGKRCASLDLVVGDSHQEKEDKPECTGRKKGRGRDDPVHG